MAVSIRTVDFGFLTLQHNLTLDAGFLTKAPLLLFFLTQIEMTGTFPIDSSTCESRILFVHCRRGTEHFWRRSDRSPGKQVYPRVRGRIPEASAPHCRQGVGSL